MGNTVCSITGVVPIEETRRTEYVPSGSSLSFAPFNPNNANYMLHPNSENILLNYEQTDYWKRIEQTKDEFVKKMKAYDIEKLIQRPPDENVETQDTTSKELEDYETVVKNLKGYLLVINEKYDSIEKQLSKNSNSQELLKQRADINLEYNSVLLKLKSLSKAVLSPRTCIICFDNEIEYFVAPCGHTLCGNCKLECERRSDNCHVCRGRRQNYNKLFL